MSPELTAGIGFGLDYSDRPKCTHFDKQSYIILGRRYAQTFDQLVASER